MDLSLYPKNWADISYDVKERAGWKCQQCDRDCMKLGENLLQFARRIMHTSQPEIGFVSMRNLSPLFNNPKKWELQACHLDQNPANNALENLKALCCSCHRKLDNGRSQRAARDYFQAERCGQLSLL
jgi:hypothetical protein